MIKNMVSIIMPTYNDGKHLESAIEDILHQTYSNFELIIVNDGSTDNTSSILSEYVKKDHRITVYNKENGGTGSALNLGFSKARGEFGTWVSSDDNKEVDFLKTMVNFLNKNRDIEYVCSVYYSALFKSPFKAYHKFGQTFRYCEGLRHDSSISGEEIIVDDWPEINYKHCFQGVCFMFTMRLKRECGDYIELPGEDYHMSMKMSLKSRVGYIDKVLGTHNNPQDSLSVVNRGCVLEAEKLTKDLYSNSEKWSLEIPKIASFYCKPKPSGEYVSSIINFKKVNPDWSVHVYWNKGNSEEHKLFLQEQIACSIKTVNFDENKALFLKYYTMVTKGGLWLNPETNLNMSMKELCKFIPNNVDVAYCYNSLSNTNIILSKPKVIFFKKAIQILQNHKGKVDLINNNLINLSEARGSFYDHNFYDLSTLLPVRKISENKQ